MVKLNQKQQYDDIVKKSGISDFAVRKVLACFGDIVTGSAERDALLEYVKGLDKTPAAPAKKPAQDTK